MISCGSIYCLNAFCLAYISSSFQLLLLPSHSDALLFISIIIVALNNRFQDDRSGVLEVNELEKLWTELMTWKGAFHQFDKDNSGFVEVSELKSVFRSVGK